MALALAQVRLWLAPSRRTKTNRRQRAAGWWAGGLKRIGLVSAAVVLLLAVSLGLVIAYQAMLTSSMFGLRQLTLTGQQRLSQSRVMALADLSPGENILALEPEVIRRRLVASPWVAEATVRRVLPDELRIHLTERRPVAVVMADHPWYVDGLGAAFKRVERGEPLDLPIISGLSEAEMRREPGREALGQVSELFRAAGRPGAPLRLKDVSEIKVDANQGLIVHTQNRGPRLILGLNRAAAHLAELGRIKAHLKSKGLWGRAVYIDLRFKGRAFVGLEEDGK